jgi:hypothetical protein
MEFDGFGSSQFSCMPVYDWLIDQAWVSRIPSATQ